MLYYIITKAYKIIFTFFEVIKMDSIIEIIGKRIFYIADPPDECTYENAKQVREYIRGLGDITWLEGEEYRMFRTEKTFFKTEVDEDERTYRYTEDQLNGQRNIDFLIGRVWDSLMSKKIGICDCVDTERYVKVKKLGNRYLVTGKDYVRYEKEGEIVRPHPFYSNIPFGIAPDNKVTFLTEIRIKGIRK